MGIGPRCPCPGVTGPRPAWMSFACCTSKSVGDSSTRTSSRLQASVGEESVGEVTLDRQHATETCEHCRGAIAVSRGSVYDDGRPSGLYLAGMHRCDVEPVAILALALLSPGGGPPQAVHLHVRGTPEAVEMV